MLQIKDYIKNYIKDYVKTGFVTWYQQQYIPGLHEGSADASTIYGIANDLDDATIDALRTWQAAGFTEV